MYMKLYFDLELPGIFKSNIGEISGCNVICQHKKEQCMNCIKTFVMEMFVFAGFRPFRFSFLFVE